MPHNRIRPPIPEETLSQLIHACVLEVLAKHLGDEQGVCPSEVAMMAAEDLPPPSRDGGEWHMSKPYRGEPFDPEKFELREGGWDHEHCEVCWTHVEPGDSYWPNVDEAGGHVDLCERCYPRVVALLEKLLH